MWEKQNSGVYTESERKRERVDPKRVPQRQRAKERWRKKVEKMASEEENGDGILIRVRGGWREAERGVGGKREETKTLPAV